MKTHIILIAVASFALFGLTGCKDYSSPKGVAETAYKAIVENDVKTFRSTLTDEMATQYGNEVEMSNLKETLLPFHDFSISKDKILDADQTELRICNPAGWHYVRSVDVRRTYETHIGGKNSDGSVTQLFRLHVNCEIRYDRVNQRGGPCHKRSGQFCQISGLY